MKFSFTTLPALSLLFVALSDPAQSRMSSAMIQRAREINDAAAALAKRDSVAVAPPPHSHHRRHHSKNKNSKRACPAGSSNVNTKSRVAVTSGNNSNSTSSSSSSNGRSSSSSSSSSPKSTSSGSSSSSSSSSSSNSSDDDDNVSPITSGTDSDSDSSSSSSSSSSGTSSSSSSVSGFSGTNVGIGSWFRTDSSQDSTNGESWCWTKYKDDWLGFAPDVSVMLKEFGGSNEKAGTAYCGREARATNPKNGNTALIYIVDGFDTKWVKTPGSIDLTIAAFEALYGSFDDNKNTVITDLQWEFTGNVKAEYGFNAS